MIDLPKGPPHVVRQIGRILDAAGEADEPVRHAVGFALGLGHARVGHRGRMVDEGFDRSETFREGEDRKGP